MAFYLDDIPAEPFVIEPPETVALDQFDEATAELTAPDGTTTALEATIADDAVNVAAPETSPFTDAGVHALRVVLIGTGKRQQLPDARIVVQDPDTGWHILDTIRAEWPDADVIPDATLWALLDVAREQVVAFAPALGEDAPIPTHYREAQRIQARNIWTAARVSPDGALGGDDFTVRPFPLDWHVKQLLRPKRGVPVVG